MGWPWLHWFQHLLNNPPWFYKQLPEPTIEDIEISILTFAINEYNLGDEDTPVQLIEIYAQ